MYFSVDEILDESNSFTFKLTLQSKIKKINKQKGVTINNMYDLIDNNYQNPGLMEVIRTEDNIKNIQYIIKNLEFDIQNAQQIKDALYNCYKLGKCSTTAGYYDNFKRQLMDKGITPQDIQKVINSNKKMLASAEQRVRQLEREQKR